MTGSESSGPNTNLWFFVAGRREGILKRCSTQDIREVRRGTQRYQKPSTVLESSNLVCKEIKCTLTPGYCVCRHPTACLSPCISRDLRTSYEGRDSAHGHKCSWAWDSNTVRPCHKNKWLWVWLSWLRACLVCLSELLVPSLACPACAYTQRSTSTYLNQEQYR